MASFVGFPLVLAPVLEVLACCRVGWKLQFGGLAQPLCLYSAAAKPVAEPNKHAVVKTKATFFTIARVRTRGLSPQPMRLRLMGLIGAGPFLHSASCAIFPAWLQGG